MCQNYIDGKCLVGNKKCLLKEEGAEAEQGDCELHGEYDVWKLKDKVVVSNLCDQPDGSEPLGYGLNFLTADEWAYKMSNRLNVPTEYNLKE